MSGALDSAGSETRGSFSDPGDDEKVIGMLMASATDRLARVFYHGELRFAYPAGPFGDAPTAVVITSRSSTETHRSSVLSKN